MSNLVGKQLGQYEILEEIGQGGMGTVYRAYQRSLDRYVAIKVLPKHLTKNAALVRRFKHEATAAARLRHPNIVVIHEAGEFQGIHYFVMEYLTGQTLKAVLEERGALPLGQAVSVAVQLARALDYAHSQGFVHRDIKPSNIFVGQDGHVTLTDFGIVRAMQESRVTQTGLGVGTPTYMSPEQGQGAEVDARSDVYSLGILLYEMLAGAPPFQADNPLVVLHQQIYETPPPLRNANPQVPEDVERIVLRALEKSPAARYQSAGELATDLLQAAGDQMQTLPVFMVPTPAPRAVTPPPTPALELPTIAEAEPRARKRGVLWAGAALTVILAVALTLTGVGALAYAVREEAATLLVSLAGLYPVTATPTPTAVETPTPVSTVFVVVPPTSRPTETPTAKPTATLVPSPTPTPKATSTRPPSPTPVKATPTPTVTATITAAAPITAKYPYHREGVITSDPDYGGVCWIWGYVHDIGGRAKPGVWLRVTREDGKVWLAQVQATDGNGYYRLQLPTGERGTYYVQVVQGPHDFTPLSELSEPIQVIDWTQAAHFRMDWRENPIPSTATPVPTPTPDYPFTNEGDVVVSEPFCDRVVRIWGHIRGADAETLARMRIKVFNYDIPWSETPPEAIKPDGTYEVQLPVGRTGFYYVVLIDRDNPNVQLSNVVRVTVGDPCKASMYEVNWRRKW